MSNRNDGRAGAFGGHRRQQVIVTIGLGILLAKCADGHFDAQAEAVFTDGTKLGGKIVRACTPKG